MTRAENWCDKAFGYQFSDAGLLARALTHRSAATDNNERLEFLGDAVLGLVIAGAVFDAKPDADEGALSRYRADLVRGESLAEIARELELAPYLVMGSGEHRTGGHQRASVLANALEALFGAILIDGGFEAAQRAILRVFATRLAELPLESELIDPKTRLQELLQARGLAPPEYELVGSTGADHARTFESNCRIEALSITTSGCGTSRRRAEQAAAGEALALFDDD